MITAPLPIILASASPQRKTLLLQAGFHFEICVPDEWAEDGRLDSEPPEEYALRLAFQKAKNVADKIQDGIIIGCDTIVLCGEDILEKPVDRDDACRMIRRLLGQVHHVLSGLCVIKKESGNGGRESVIQETATTQLFMQPISDSEIDVYLDTGIWQGKSGAFAFQVCRDWPGCKGWLSIMEGSESNVVGLPMELLQTVLARLASAR